ncbi:NADPH-dependent FMN reductase [Aerococcus urinaeequi]|uniref:NAD(P)H-dependent oxidoreductase n=1 Tax=Aerococcus viridans TaxID=1377 RepID=A0A2N6UED6_9LACT|nr:MULTISPECIES: NADPH-dependent FMN reductase [Aerococcus]OFU49833.1 NADPH-dependent FMN reductase [Aerococcus sp. HMSC10H05]PMC79905.1 NAD(P)H-dependent oxidoreductase [Aerococcus viridans]
MNFIAIVGTNSSRSTNRKLLQFIAKHFADQANIEVVEIADIPAFNEPKDTPAPQAVTQLAKKIEESDGVIISTPEYDHSIPAQLKSVLEWMSYSYQPFINKPVMITGASLGSLGSSRAQIHLRQILDSPEIKARIMPSSEYLLSHSGDAFNEEGQLVYEDKVTELEELFTEFLQFVKINQQLIASHDHQTLRRHEFSWKDIID